MTCRSAGLALAAALLSVSVIACRKAPDEKSLPRVRIGYRPHLTLAPVFIAKAEGLYEAEGLDVELVPIEGVASSVPLLLQGGLDVLPGPVTAGLFNAISRGGRLRVVQEKGWYFPDDCFPTAIVRSKQLAARNGMPRRLGTTKETFLQMFTDRTLRAHGVDPKTVELVYIPAAAEFDAIVAGRLDAANLGEPWLSRALAQGAVVWEPVNRLMGRDTYSVISYGPSLLDESPDLGERVSRAHLKAMRLYNQGKTERNLEIVAGMLGFTPDDLRTTCWPKMREDGLIDTMSLRKFQEWSKARGELDEVLPVERYWDGRFVDRAAGANRRMP